MRDVERRTRVRFESHSLTHRDLPPLPEDEARREIAGSAQLLAAELGRPVRLFCYPRGYFGPREEALAAGGRVRGGGRHGVRREPGAATTATRCAARSATASTTASCCAPASAGWSTGRRRGGRRGAPPGSREGFNQALTPAFVPACRPDAMLCLYEPHDGNADHRGQIHMKRHQIGYGVALLVGLPSPASAPGRSPSRPASRPPRPATTTVTMPGTTDAVTTTAPGTTTTVTTTAPTTTTRRRRQRVEDISGPCDEAEHANDPRCTGVGAANPTAGDDDANENEADHQNAVRTVGRAGDDNRPTTTPVTATAATTARRNGTTRIDAQRRQRRRQWRRRQRRRQRRRRRRRRRQRRRPRRRRRPGRLVRRDEPTLTVHGTENDAGGTGRGGDMPPRPVASYDAVTVSSTRERSCSSRTRTSITEPLTAALAARGLGHPRHAERPRGARPGRPPRRPTSCCST